MYVKTFFLFIAAGTVLFSSCQNPKEKKEIEYNEVPPDVENNFNLPKLPQEVVFAGKSIKIDNFDLKERLDKELITNTFYHSSTIQSFKRANRFFDVISQILKENNIPDDFKYLCLIESGLTQATSPSGAKGFWQFMPQTGKEYGLKVNSEVDERLHIVKSTEAACAYLHDAYKVFNDWTLTAASYNRGVSGIENDLESQYVEDYFDLNLNNETSRYVFRILALKLIFESPQDYGFDPLKMELYEPIETKEILVDEPINDMAEWSVKQGTTLRLVKLLNPWIRTNRLTPKQEVFKILLPK